MKTNTQLVISTLGFLVSVVLMCSGHLDYAIYFMLQAIYLILQGIYLADSKLGKDEG